MIVQESVWAVMCRNPNGEGWKCLGITTDEDEAEAIARVAIETVTQSYSFHNQSLRSAVDAALQTVRIIPAVLGYDDWDMIRVE